MQYFFVIISLFLSLNVSAKDDFSLSELMEKCEEARSLSQYESMEKYSAEMLKSAVSSGKTREQTYAYFYNGLSKLFLGKAEESKKMLEKAEEMSTSIGNDSVRALVMNTMGIYHALIKNNRFVAQQYFFKSLELANKARYNDLQNRVRGNLLTLTHSMGGKVVLENAKEVYDYGIKTNNDEQISLGAYYLATYYFKNGNYTQTEKYLNIALDIYKRHPYEDIASVYALYAKTMQKKGNLDEAANYASQSIILAERYHQTAMEVDAYITYAEVLSDKNKPLEAIAKLNIAMKKAEEIGMTSKEIDCNQLLAKNYSLTGNNSEAIKHLQTANRLLGEQSSINMERLSYEQDAMHELEQKEAEAKIKQEQIAAQRQFLIMLGIVVIILIVLLVFIYISSRKRKRLYKQIVKQNNLSIARQEMLQTVIEDLNKQLSEQGKTEEEEKETKSLGNEKIDTLYTKLCSLMDNERLYAEAQLTREKVAERLGTNRTYLTTVIKEKTGMSFLQFINTYRINDAIRILSDKEKMDYPLKQIWYDLGFSSASTFFKLFQQTVGITPSAYRKQVIEVNDDAIWIEEQEP